MDALNDWFTSHASQWGWHAEAGIRLLVATLLAGLVGIEREIRGRQAGFRTNILVGLGSALVMLVSIRFAHDHWPHSPDFNVNIDPGRIAYGVMTGIGFLGAGAIVKHGVSVRGLTTAAGMWCVAAIGLAAGFGLYVLAALGAIIVLIALWILDYVEEIMPSRKFRKLVVRCGWCPTCVKDLVTQVEKQGFHVYEHSFQRAGDTGRVDIEISLSYSGNRRFSQLMESLEFQEGCELMSSTPV